MFLNILLKEGARKRSKQSVAHVFNPRIQEVEVGKSLNYKQAWSTEGFTGQPAIRRNPVSKTRNKERNKKERVSLLFTYSGIP